MVIKRLVSSISTLISLKWRHRLKEPPSSSSLSCEVFGSSDRDEFQKEQVRKGSPDESLEGDDELCCVCLSRLEESGEDTRLLACTHEFHRACIERWFDVCRKTCPVCRLFVEGEEEKIKKREELPEEMVIWFSSFHAAGF